MREPHRNALAREMGQGPPAAPLSPIEDVEHGMVPCRWVERMQGRGSRSQGQRLPNGLLRDLLLAAGHTREKLKPLGSLKLLQTLVNISTSTGRPWMHSALLPSRTI